LPAGMGRTGGKARWLLVAAVTAAGLLGVVTVWVTLALLTGLACGWMALVAALDFALLLRLVLAPVGPARTAIAVLATVLACVASGWLIVAGQFGSMLGLDPIASAIRLGPVLAWEFTRLGFAPWDWACVAFSPVLAFALLRDRRGTASGG
jgi:hypothetical protein